VVYGSDADGLMAFNITNADGSGRPQRIAGAGVNAPSCIATADGVTGLVYVDEGDIWFQPLEGRCRTSLRMGSG
jgi:hypothetical protein